MTEGLWGVGGLRMGDEMRDHPVGLSEMERDVAAAVKTLDSLGVKAGSRVLVISLLSEAPLYWPVLCALVARGAQVSCADATAGDAARVAMLLDRLRYDAVAGIAADTLDGLEALGGGPGMWESVQLLGARRGAHERLSAAGLEPRWWVHAGGALGVECEARAGAHIDGDEWDASAERGEVIVRARRPRAGEPVSTGIAGEVAREPCACGRTDPRIVPSEGGT